MPRHGHGRVERRMDGDSQVRGWLKAVLRMRVLGLEPRTYGLKGRCSAN